MNFPQFISQLLGESAQTTQLNIIKVVNNIQTQLVTILNYLGSKVQLNNVILTSITLPVGTTPVPHTLGKVWSGFSVIKWRGCTGTIVDASNQPTSNTYITLTVSQACVVDILIF